MRLCAVVKVQRAAMVKGMEPATMVIKEATLESAALHPDEEPHRPQTAPGDLIRVCVPITLVQGVLPMEGLEAPG